MELSLAYPNRSFIICGCSEAFNYAAIFMICGGGTSYGWQERYILKPLGAPLPINPIISYVLALLFGVSDNIEGTINTHRSLGP